jgi:hypothetical protein
MTPAVVRTRCTRWTAGAPEHPAFPAQWFYGLCRDLPGAEFLWPPSPTDWRWIEARSGPTISIGLTPATGARTTRFCRPQLPRAIRLNRPACCRKKFRPRRLSAVRLRDAPAHGRPALRTPLAPDAAASTATCPNVRDDGQRPSSRDRMAGVLLLIWGRGEADYFCARDWTGQITLNRLRKIDFARIGRTVAGLPMRHGIICEMAHRQESLNLVMLSGWSPSVGLHHAVSKAVAP